MTSTKSHLWTVFVDLTCLSLMLTALMLIKYLAPTFQQGFFCSDLTLRLPYHHSTIVTWVNVSISYGSTLFLIFVTRVVARRGRLEQIWDDVKVFFFGGLVTQLLSNVCKVFVGRLRPHFLSVCNPSLLPVCELPTSLIYLTNVTCRGNMDLFPDIGEREHRVEEARLSFLSGHASLAWYGMVYSVLFLQFHLRTRSPGSPLPLLLLQTSLLTYSLVTGITRVTDHKHHTGDVVAGALLGSFVAIFTFLSNFIEEVRPEKDKKRDFQEKESNRPSNRRDGTVDSSQG